MGGIYIQCGEFMGDDKSCSAIDGVIEDMKSGKGGFDTGLLDGLFQQGDESENVAYILSPSNPEGLLVGLWKMETLYKSMHPGIDDWYEIFEKETSLGMKPTDGKYGESIGWRLYCVQDLIKAVKAYCDNHQEIVLTFD